VITIYTYNVEGFYTGSQPLSEDPLNPGTYIIPSGATSKKPPVLESFQILQFQNNDWRIVSDYRGVTACEVDDDNIFIGEYIFVLGEVPSSRIILTVVPIKNAFYKAKWDGTKWVESLTQEEIDIIIASIPQSPIEIANKFAYLYIQIESLRADLSLTTDNLNQFVDFLCSTLEELK